MYRITKLISSGIFNTMKDTALICLFFQFMGLFEVGIAIFCVIFVFIMIGRVVR